MKIFIVHRDVPYEFGEVWGVFLTEEAARLFVSKIEIGRLEIGIQVWDTDGNRCIEEIGAPIT